MKILNHKSKVNGQFYFSIVARNGKIIAQSEGYKSKASRGRTIASLQKSVGTAKIVELVK